MAYTTKQICICNGCGKMIKKDQEDCLNICKEWGYFSEKDMELHEFNLCEKCYDEFISKLKVPVKVTEMTEVL